MCVCLCAKCTHFHCAPNCFSVFLHIYFCRFFNIFLCTLFVSTAHSVYMQPNVFEYTRWRYNKCEMQYLNVDIWFVVYAAPQWKEKEKEALTMWTDWYPYTNWLAEKVRTVKKKEKKELCYGLAMSFLTRIISKNMLRYRLFQMEFAVPTISEQCRNGRQSKNKICDIVFHTIYF